MCSVLGVCCNPHPVVGQSREKETEWVTRCSYRLHLYKNAAPSYLNFELYTKSAQVWKRNGKKNLQSSVPKTLGSDPLALSPTVGCSKLCSEFENCNELSKNR